MSLRNQVLKTYKSLQKARQKVFTGDGRALEAARLKIREEFLKNQHVKDEQAIRALIKLGEDVEIEMRQTIIQAKETKPGVYEAVITDDIPKLENVPFDDSAVLPDGTVKSCCKNKNN